MSKGKPPTIVDKEKMVAALAAVEKDGPLGNRGLLYRAVADEYNRLGPPKEISFSVVMARLEDWKLELKTPMGRRGRVAGTVIGVRPSINLDETVSVDEDDEAPLIYATDKPVAKQPWVRPNPLPVQAQAVSMEPIAAQIPIDGKYLPNQVHQELCALRSNRLALDDSPLYSQWRDYIVEKFTDPAFAESVAKDGFSGIFHREYGSILADLKEIGILGEKPPVLEVAEVA